MPRISATCSSVMPEAPTGTGASFTNSEVSASLVASLAEMSAAPPAGLSAVCCAALSVSLTTPETVSCGGATTAAIAGALLVVDARLLQLGIEKEGVLGVAGEVPAPAVAALANSFFADHAGAAAGALARCATL